VTGRLDRGRLTGWTLLVAALALLGYASRAAGGKPDRDVAYQYSTAVSGVVQYAIILAVVLAITRPEWRLLALRRPSSYARAASTALLALAAVYAASAVVSAYGDPGREQGLTPDTWDSHRAAQFAVNFVVFAGVAPVVEELTFRGLGYSLLAPLGQWTAVLWVGLAFGLAHGLIEGLPILIVFGAGLALLRARTDSVYPGIVVHSAFNAVALIVSVTT
jgi:membrane protease YdiL (CAAX protease family)